MEYDITEMFLENYNRPRTPLTPQGVVIHETASPGSPAINFYEYFNSANRDSSAHFFIDDTMILNTIPINEVAWHAARTANNRFIGIELTHFDNDVPKFTEIYNRGVWLTARLLADMGIKTVTPDNVLSHKEVGERWHETNHIDPDGYFYSYGKDINMFRQDVQNVLNTMERRYNAMNDNTVSDWAKSSVNQVVEAGIMSGYTNGQFGGKDYVTREQLAQVIVNMKNLGIISF